MSGVAYVKNTTITDEDNSNNNYFLWLSGDVTLDNCTMTLSRTPIGLDVAGNVTILDGTYTNTSGIAIKAEKNSTQNNKLIIGTKEYPVTETLRIYGSTYGIYRDIENAYYQANIYLYDGVIEGGTNAIVEARQYQTPTPIEKAGISDYPRFYEPAYVGNGTDIVDTDKKIFKLVPDADYNNVVSVGNQDFNPDNYQSAVAQAISSNQPIVVNHSFEVYNTWVISGASTAELTIDLKGNSISGNIVGALVENNINLTITDSVGGGYIKNENGVAIDNKGTLNIGITGSGTQDPAIISLSTSITNTGTVNLESGIIKGVTATVTGGTVNPANVQTGTVTEDEITYNTMYLPD